MKYRLISHYLRENWILQINYWEIIAMENLTMSGWAFRPGLLWHLAVSYVIRSSQPTKNCPRTETAVLPAYPSLGTTAKWLEPWRGGRRKCTRLMRYVHGEILVRPRLLSLVPSETRNESKYHGISWMMEMTDLNLFLKFKIIFEYLPAIRIFFYFYINS